jgi:aminoglycoside phosphotransferase (APT) family kinase protein
MTPQEIEARLASFLAQRLGSPLQVRGLERNTEGFSQETFSFAVELAGKTRRYVAKREPVAGLLEPYDLEPEFRVLHGLEGADVLSPPTPWFSDDPRVFERPFYVMERLPGEVPLPTAGANGGGPFTAGERESLAPQVAAALARLHAVDWKKRGFDFLGVPAAGRGAAERELARWEERIARAGFALPPLLADALAWLRRSLPDAPEITLVHGDFRLGNWLVAQHGDAATLLGVLDWEMVHLGDPLEDLAWCSCELWRGGTPFAGAMVAPEAFAAAYATASGRVVDAERMAFYRVLAVVKMIAIMLTGIRAFRDGRTSDLRMAIFDHQLPFLFALLALVRGWLSGGSAC